MRTFGNLAATWRHACGLSETLPQLGGWRKTVRNGLPYALRLQKKAYFCDKVSFLLPMMFVDVILPLPLPGTFTYRVPDTVDVALRPGMRVVVPVGKRKLYTGLVYVVHTFEPQTDYVLKDIVCVLDDAPVLRHTQLKLWKWVSDYYMSPLGDVYKAALPSAMKLESETKVTLNVDFEAAEPLPQKLQAVLFALSDGKPHGLDELARKADVKNLMPALDKLLAMGAVCVDEALRTVYKPKTETYVFLHERFTDNEQLQAAFSALNRAPKQLALLMYYLELSGFMQTGVAAEVNRKILLDKAQATTANLNQLVDKQLFVQVRRQVGRLDCGKQPLRALPELTSAQQEACSAIYRQWQEHNVVLLHGITSCGKTEMYIHLIGQVLKTGRQVLYLVPEIALTTQLTDRLQAVFGDKLGVYHSKFSDAERVEIYQDLLQDKHYQVILGVRSSVFLPFRQLGLVIVDEEHETSYKQQEPSPRYHARNVAIVLAQMHGAKVLLGTATPSVESYYNAKSGKYGLVELFRRYKDIQLPAITVVDTQVARHKKCMNGHFADVLVEKIGAALSRHEQVILFQNRRGYAPYVSCRSCGAAVKCQFCDVSMTLHKHSNLLVCHYCGYTQTLPHQCPECGGGLSDRGLGTEKVEDEVQKLFPQARVARMDLDTTHTRNAYQRLISDFAGHKIDILVGTQMVSKGLNFEDVSLVAVLNADHLLHLPDFRAFERAFQMLEQVSGRAGRMHGQGEMVLQTANPDNTVIRHVVAHDYSSLYEEQIAERRQFRYPPYYRLLQVVVKHRDCAKADVAARMLAETMQQVFGNRCSAVVQPVIGKVQNMHIRQILLRIEAEASVAKAKELLQQQIELVRQQDACKGSVIFVDVDPV